MPRTFDLSVSDEDYAVLSKAGVDPLDVAAKAVAKKVAEAKGTAAGPTEEASAEETAAPSE